MQQIYKYPRTQHIEGSGLQAGDQDLAIAPFQQLAGKHLVVEEKMDGANSAVSFTSDGRLLLQSRGHYLTGGPRERQFHLFKAWATRYSAALHTLLSDRYVMYGEWLYAKHTIFYTDLPHYFLEFDIYDVKQALFLSTPHRLALLESAPFIASVHVLHQGSIPTLAGLQAMIGHSNFIAADHREQLRQACEQQGLNTGQVLHESDPSGRMEGLYIKVEAHDEVVERYKYIRAGFLQTVVESQSHWMDRPQITNRLHSDVSLF